MRAFTRTFDESEKLVRLWREMLDAGDNLTIKEIVEKYEHLNIHAPLKINLIGLFQKTAVRVHSYVFQAIPYDELPTSHKILTKYSGRLSCNVISFYIDVLDYGKNLSKDELKSIFYVSDEQLDLLLKYLSEIKFITVDKTLGVPLFSPVEPNDLPPLKKISATLSQWGQNCFPRPVGMRRARIEVEQKKRKTAELRHSKSFCFQDMVQKMISQTKENEKEFYEHTGTLR